MGAWVEAEYLRDLPVRDRFNDEYYCYILWFEEDFLYYVGHSGNMSERMDEHDRKKRGVTSDYFRHEKVWQSERLRTRAAVKQLEATLKGRILRNEVDKFEERTGLTFMKGATLLDSVEERY